jgi:hypothetical protein
MYVTSSETWLHKFCGVNFSVLLANRRAVCTRVAEFLVANINRCILNFAINILYVKTILTTCVPGKNMFTGTRNKALGPNNIEVSYNIPL